MPVDFSPLMDVSAINPMRIVNRVEAAQQRELYKTMTMYQFLRQKKLGATSPVFKDGSYQLPMLYSDNAWGNYG